MNEKIHEKLSDLMLFAVNFEKGDKIYLKFEYNLRDTALKISEKAYQKGAAYVHLEYDDAIARAHAIAGSSKDFYFPSFWDAQIEEITSGGWKLISLGSESEADVFEGLDTERASRYFKELSRAKEKHQKAIMSNALPWSLTYLPSVQMAKKAFPELNADQAVERYWEAIIRIMKLDLDDPVAYWKKKMEEDIQRSQYMEELNATHLHFEGPGTDLKVGIASSARWIGGFDKSRDGVDFMANIPTAEIFTSPDWRQTEGRVRLSKPFVMHQSLGPVPINAWFEFKEGKVVDFGADQGKETLQAFFNIDERARFIGEVALVDPQSPFAKEGITYYNGLYDENAACHIALGKAYPFTLKEQGDFSNEELLNLGLNTANVHEDMMIGGEDVDVTAILADGSRKAIIKDGHFVI